MIKLTDRLQLMADQIQRNETMADIGTDHGFLPIYLWENEISPKVIMADISPGLEFPAGKFRMAVEVSAHFDGFRQNPGHFIPQGIHVSPPVCR